MTGWTILALAFLAGAAWMALDAVNQLIFQRPVAGSVVATSYSESERLAARADHPWDWMYKVTTGNMKPVVSDLLTIEYEVDGRTYRQDVETAHMRGDSAETAPLVWYDPANPERITLDGPGGSAFLSLAFLGLAAWSFGLI